MQPDEQTPPIVVRDLFPAEVTVGATVYRTARALLTGSRVHVFIASDGKPLEVLDAEYDPIISALGGRSGPRHVQASHLILLNGEAVHVNKQRGCGCGNPLKALSTTTLLPGARLGAA